MTILRTYGFRIRGLATPALFVGLAMLVGACATNPVPEPLLSEEEQVERNKRAVMHYDLGVQQLEAGNIPVAIRELLMAAKYEPDDAPIRLALGEAYRRRGRPEEAEANFLRALELDPEFQRARLSLSAFYASVSRFEDARAQAEVLVDDPTFAWPWLAHTNLGWAQYKLGDTRNARKNLLVALDYRENYWPARLNLGILEADQKHPREALDQFRQVLAQQPGPHAEAEAHYRMAELLIGLGQRDRAILHLTESANRKPSGPWGQRSNEALARLN